jgi:imidazolonepropionase-like amidohydrolase
MLGALSAAHTLASRGITTVRDSYGVLPPLLAARDRIASGAATGSTILAAGNILGWGGPWSFSFSGSDGSSPPTEYGRHLRDAIVQGMGESLIDLSPDSLAARLGRYLDTGVDFVKIGVTIHTERPTFILFSPRALDAMVRTAHARGRKVDVHAGSAEGLRMATQAGVDLLQHPETVGDPLPPDLVDSIRIRGTMCGLTPARLTGAEWARFQEHLAQGGRMWPAEMPPARMQALADSLRRSGIDPASRPRTASVTRYQNQRRNAETLIRAGCAVAVATDMVVGLPGAAATRPLGDSFFAAVEGLVELGMTPAQAIVSATRNGAAAAGRLEAIGTLAPGKRADLVLLDADPLADVRNLRRTSLVILGGRLVR